MFRTPALIILFRPLHHPLDSDRLFTQTQKRFKVCEERVKEHISALALLQQPGLEVLGDPADDPYDFKEGDIEYSFPTSKRLKGQGRDPNRKSKVSLAASGSVRY